MPIVRYQIKNEYGLADPELYESADKEDPEALLEGVAMAGLVGVLRQLGDLAEFAAEIFHNLHEEVMATAARGHALMLRVQQLEVDFPAIERVFPSHSVHSQLSYNAGVDWHPNLQIDQNLVTREDMPRFILDSYEESRGPPRLFMLDKFDVAGDGACLKRYSNPSFFKMDFASSGKMEPDIQREKKSRKNKKKGPRWRNGETPEAHTTQHVDPKSEHMASGKAPENPPVKRVKLKARQLNDTTSIRRSYIEHIVEKQSPEHTHLPENSISHSQVKMKTINSTELVPDVHEVIMDTSIRKPFFRERNQTKSDMRDSQDEKKGLQEVTGEVERLPPTFNDQKKLFDADYKREGNDDAESRTNGSLDGYRSDDAASELDNYLDALTTMDSEIETDNETKTKPAPNFFSKEYNKTDSNANEERELLDECLGSHIFRESSAQNSLSNKRVSSPNEDLSNGLADSTPAHGTSRSLPGMCLDPETLAGETNGIHFEGKANSELLGKDSPIDLVPKQVTPDIPIPLSESGVESSRFCTADTTATSNYTSLHASPEDIQSAAANQNTLSSHIDSTERRDVCFDSESSPPVNLDALGTAEDTNVTLSNLVVGDGEANKILKDDFHQRPDESKIPSIMEEDYANPGPVSKNTENFSDALWQLGDQSDFNLQIQDDPSRETQIALPGTEEPNAEVIMSMLTVSDLTQMPKATNLEITSPVCIEDSPLPLSMFNEELHGSVCQVPEVDSGESTLPGKCPPVLPLDDGSTSFVLDGLCGPVHDSVLSNEKVECARLLTCLEDAADFSENKVSSPENTGNFAENEVITSGILLPEASFDMKVPQESCNLDQMEFTQNGELVPQESCNLGQVEFTQRDELHEILKVPPNVSNYETNDSFLVSETRDSPLPTGDNQNLISTPPFSSPVESLPAEGCSSHSVTECTETDELDSAIVHSKESSSNNTKLHEDHFSLDSVSEQQRLQVKEASYLKDLIESGVQLVPGAVAYEEEYVVVTASQDSVSAGCVLDSSCQPDSGVQLVPDTVASQEEYFVISGPQDSVSAGCVIDSSSQPESGVQQVPGTVACQEDYVAVSSLQDSVSAGYVFDSSSQPDSGENSHICTEPFELAQEDLYPSDGSRAAISSVEEEGGKLLSPILQNESNSINSVVEHYLGNVKLSNSEDLIAQDVQQASKVAFPGQEESDAATDPRGSKSAESTHDSLDHVDMKPVPCQEDSKMVASPQNSGTEERLLESSNMSDIDLAKHAEGNMHPLEANEVIGRPLESQQVSHSKPLALCKPCLAANGDISLSDNVITESISPPKEVSAVQYSNESDENSLLQKLESLRLSNNQFERQQSHELEDNSLTTETQHLVPQAAQDSVEVVTSGKIYELDKTSANVASSNLVETEVDYPLQPNHGIPASSAISSASLASLPTFPSLGASSTLMIQQQSSKLPLDGDPPLPPLPPLQWRMGKLRPSSVMINEETAMPQSGLNNLTTLPSLDHSGDSLGMGGVAVQPSNPFLQVQMHPNDSGWFGYQGLEEERMNPFQSNALPPAMEGQKFPDDLLASDIQMKHLPAISSSVVSHAEDDRQKNEFCQGALSGDIPQSLNPFTSPLELSDVRSQHFQRVSERESVEPPESSASQPTFVYTESLHEAANLEAGAIHPFNPFLSSTPTEGEHHQYDDREFGSRTGHHLDCPDPSSTADVAPQGFLISQGGNMQSFEGDTLPTAEHGQPNGRPRSLLNRPRDPLIEAVASHDKSTLRRVSELVRPSATPEGERNTLLEQIRNKSFNLKPATVAKPDIKGPPTNLKVAAILERANAIRQAFAGSDEDDDGESWSDS